MKKQKQKKTHVKPKLRLNVNNNYEIIETRQSNYSNTNVMIQDPYVTEAELDLHKVTENFETPVEDRDRNIGYDPN